MSSYEDIENEVARRIRAGRRADSSLATVDFDKGVVEVGHLMPLANGLQGTRTRLEIDPDTLSKLLDTTRP